MDGFRERLRDARPLLFDGGFGTQLQLRGLPVGEQPETFCLARPDVVRAIVSDYLKAGSDMVTTPTFGGSSFKLARHIKEEVGVRAFNKRMAEVTRSAVDDGGRPAFVCGDMGPSGQFVAPLGEITPFEMMTAFREQAIGLAAGGVDAFVVETQIDLAEARLIVAAIREVSDLPIIVSMSFDHGLTLTGTTPEIFAATMRNMGVDVIGVNCGAGPAEMAGVVGRLLARAGIPVLAQPNAGLPEIVDGRTVFPLAPEAFASLTADFVRKGVKIVGGCCGTTPSHIDFLRRAVDTIDGCEAAHAPMPGISLTTRSTSVRIGGDAPLVFIGERINPTGKKRLQVELTAGKLALALSYAEEQVSMKTPVLDVNVGTPMVDETVLLPRLTKELVSRVQVPLSLDSANPDALAVALPWYPGSALVNSINGDVGRLERLGPLCRRFGSPFILLPLKGRKMPVLAKERIAIIEAMLLRMEALGLPRDMVLVDVLALSIASKPEAAKEGLATIRWCVGQGVPTCIGLSNISFGLPARELVNATFLAMAQGAGLSACIVNPMSRLMQDARAAGDVLVGRDVGATAFVEQYAGWTGPSSERQPVPSVTRSDEKGCAGTVYDAVLQGDTDRIEALVKNDLAKAIAPFDIVNQSMIPAINEVGVRYGRREYFLPQLLRSAEAMKKGFAYLQPMIAASGRQADRPVVVLATVEGDIHDIGKNIVALLMGNHGFDVVDLGKDVKAEDIVSAAVERRAKIIGLSALMTTTMIHMEDTVKLVKKRGLDIRVMVGGAVVTEGFARAIGADAYSADAVEAVAVAKRLATWGDDV